MSPAQFAEFILPGIMEVVNAAKRAGGYCIKHTDGNIWEIMDPEDTGGILIFRYTGATLVLTRRFVPPII